MPLGFFICKIIRFVFETIFEMMKTNFKNGLMFILATAFLYLGSCSPDAIEPLEDPSTTTNKLIGYWHGGANYFGLDLNLEFTESTLTMTDYDNSQSIGYGCVYADNKITITENGTSQSSVLSYVMSGTSSVTFTDEDGDSFSLQSGKGSNGSGGGGSGGGGSGGGSNPEFEVSITEYTLTACSKTGEREFNVETEAYDRVVSPSLWQTNDVLMEIPDDLPYAPWDVLEEPDMSFEEINDGNRFLIKLNYIGSNGDDYSLGGVYVRIKDYYDTKPSMITIVETGGPNTWTMNVHLEWTEE